MLMVVSFFLLVLCSGSNCKSSPGFELGLSYLRTSRDTRPPSRDATAGRCSPVQPQTKANCFGVMRPKDESPGGEETPGGGSQMSIQIVVDGALIWLKSGGLRETQDLN